MCTVFCVPWASTSGTCREQMLDQMLSSQLVSLISLISRAGWTHLLMSHQTRKVQFLLLELKGDMVQIWNRVALKSTWGVCSAHCQSPQGCTEIELKTFLCFVSLLREGKVCGRSKNCKTWISGRKSNQATHTDIVFSLMLLFTVWPMQTRSLIYRLLCR